MQKSRDPKGIELMTLADSLCVLAENKRALTFKDSSDADRQRVDFTRFMATNSQVRLAIRILPMR